MRFFKRIAGILGFLKDEPNEDPNEDDKDHPQPNPHHQHRHHRQGPGDTQDARHLAIAVGPLLTHSSLGDGGVQGLRWYARRLRIDEDGDVADEFLDEVLPEVVDMPPNIDEQRPTPKFEVKYRTRPAKVKKQMISFDGKIQQGVEYQGRLQWV